MLKYCLIFIIIFFSNILFIYSSDIENSSDISKETKIEFFDNHYNKNGYFLRTEKEFFLALSPFPDIQNSYNKRINELNKIQKGASISEIVIYSISLVCSITSIPFFVQYLIEDNKKVIDVGKLDYLSKFSWSFFGSGLGLAGIGLILFFAFTAYNKSEIKKARAKAVQEYNNLIESKNQSSMIPYFDYTLDNKLFLGMIIKI